MSTIIEHHQVLDVEQIDPPRHRVSPEPHKIDPRPTVEPSNPWGFWSSLEGRTKEENTWESLRILADVELHVWSSHNYSDKLTPLILRDLLVGGTERGPKWPIRIYNAVDVRLERCEFRWSGRYGQEGHPAYLNLWRDLWVDRCVFRDSLGQFQVVWRGRETLLEGWPEGRIFFNRCQFRDMGGGDRSSFPLSIHGPGQTVDVVRCDLWTTERTPEWYKSIGDGPYRSRGGISVHAGEGPSTPRVRIKDTRISLIDSDRAAINLVAVDEVLVEGGVVQDVGGHGRAQIAIGPRCPRGRIHGVTGDYNIVRTDGLRVTRILATNEDFSWESEDELED